jgi:hypothetical protein
MRCGAGILQNVRPRSSDLVRIGSTTDRQPWTASDRSGEYVSWNRRSPGLGPEAWPPRARSQPHREPAGIGEPERSRSVSGPWTQA